MLLCYVIMLLLCYAISCDHIFEVHRSEVLLETEVFVNNIILDSRHLLTFEENP